MHTKTKAYSKFSIIYFKYKNADRSLRFETGMLIAFFILSVRERLVGFQKIFLHENMRQAYLFGTNSESVQTKR